MHNTTDYAIDLETLSTSRLELPAIVEIAAVEFDRCTGKIEREFHELIELESAMNIGKVDADTLRFWFSQKNAESVMNKGYRIGLYEAMISLGRFLNQGQDRRIWSWGAEFDLRIVLATNQAMNDPLWPNPIIYKDIRDARTYCTEIAEQFGIILPTQNLKTKHSALDDAIHCARLVSGVYSQMMVAAERLE